MALNLKNPAAEQLAQDVARETGESLTEAVTVALRDRLARVRHDAVQPHLYADIEQIQAFVRELPDLGSANPDEILYDPPTGLPR